MTWYTYCTCLNFQRFTDSLSISEWLERAPAVLANHNDRPMMAVIGIPDLQALDLVEESVAEWREVIEFQVSSETRCGFGRTVLFLSEGLGTS